MDRLAVWPEPIQIEPCEAEFTQRVREFDRIRKVRTQRSLRQALRVAFDERGSVMVEYTVLLSVVAVGLCFSIAALGVPLIRMYLSQQTWLLLPFP